MVTEGPAPLATTMVAEGPGLLQGQTPVVGAWQYVPSLQYPQQLNDPQPSLMAEDLRVFPGWTPPPRAVVDGHPSVTEADRRRSLEGTPPRVAAVDSHPSVLEAHPSVEDKEAKRASARPRICQPLLEEVGDFDSFSFLDLDPLRSPKGHGWKHVRFPKMSSSVEDSLTQQPTSTVSYAAPFDSNEALVAYVSRPGGCLERFRGETGINFLPLLEVLSSPGYDKVYGFTTRIRTALPFWKHVIGITPALERDIVEGVRLPWNVPREDIPRMDLSNSADSFAHDELLVLNAMAQKALGMKVLRKMAGPGHCNLKPFCVEKNIHAVDPLDRYRPILDGSPLSKWLDDMDFTLESLREFVYSLFPGDELVGSDISDAYFLVAIHPDDWDYLCMGIPDMQGVMQYYGYIAMPQGLKPSAYYFERCMKPVRRCIAKRTRLPVYGYLDDIRGVVRQWDGSEELALANTEMMFAILMLGGFRVSWKKSFTRPTRTTPITGYLLDTSGVAVEVEILIKRWSKLRAVAVQLLEAPLITPRLVARFGGGLQSCYVVLPRARLHLRGCYHLLLVASKYGWDAAFQLPEFHLGRKEIKRWAKVLTGPPARLRIDTRPLIQLPAQFDTFSDAGDKAVGGVCRPAWVSPLELMQCLEAYQAGERDLVFYASESSTAAGQEVVTAANLALEDQTKSSTLRELRAVIHLLLAFADRIRGSTLRVFVDNQSLISILRNGSSKMECHLLALQVDAIVSYLELEPRFIWIPRCLNARADLFSHVYDLDDYFWTPASFAALCQHWEFYPEVDLFATAANRQPGCPKFVSKLPQPGAWTQDALSLDWAEDFRRIYLFPPCGDMARVVAHLQQMSRISAMVVVPLFKRQPHMRWLLPDGRHFSRNIKAYWFLSRGVDIVRGPVGEPSFLQEPFRGHRHLFLAVLWESPGHTGAVPRGGWTRRSQFSHRFCLERHFGGECAECTSQ